MRFARRLQLFTAAACVALAAPVSADVKDGVDAWSRGDYRAAVEEWRGPADSGDPDAQFNMAQAYRLGRGVERDAAQAEILYAKAAAQGHVKAADNYGLMLFQADRRAQAMPYVAAAADRGDPRAQYLLGIAHFNGDIVDKDWVRAYALLTLANSAGLPQAAPAIRQMDGHIPLAQRQEAQALAQSLKRDSDATRAQQLAAADLAMGGAAAVATAPAPEAEPPASALPAVSGRVPEPIAAVGTSPSIASAQAAIDEASRVTGTQSPAEAGADYARPTPAPVPAPTTSTPTPAPRQSVEAETPAPATPPESREPTTSDGPWRVQLGAFSVSGNAERLWADASGLPALKGTTKLLVPSGRLTKLQAGGFASRAAAQAACDALKAGGRDCLVTR